MRVSDAQRRDTEDRIRATARALLRGELPPGGKCDTTTLARLAGISRATLYRSYPHLKAEFEKQFADLHATGGTVVDSRDAQITRLKRDNADLHRRLAERDSQLAEHEAFRTLAISRLAAQHDEIHRLRTAAAAPAGTLRALPTRRSTGQIGPC
ncbi:hypothetical protein [Pseudofrankia sp. DC12]|uniref:hypothetical protein n=1 Tax=Pseudofrankia sp. DC12 TaxID=683315 RepID=UPI0005F7B29A|nr:hypothetical protein [Pseudofrankia sp. DC12]